MDRSPLRDKYSILQPANKKEELNSNHCYKVQIINPILSLNISTSKNQTYK